jgi:hypothetical protein
METHRHKEEKQRERERGGGKTGLEKSHMKQANRY